MNEKTSLELALTALADELEGVKEYSEIIEYCKDPELVEIAKLLVVDEKKHVQHLMQFVGKRVQLALSK